MTIFVWHVDWAVYLGLQTFLILTIFKASQINWSVIIFQKTWAEGIASILSCRLSRLENNNILESSAITEIFFLKRQICLRSSLVHEDHLNVQKAPFHWSILLLQSEKDDILLVENRVIFWITWIPTNAACSFLDCEKKFNEWKSGLSVVETLNS